MRNSLLLHPSAFLIVGMKRPSKQSVPAADIQPDEGRSLG
jgi:hypothetical protein